MKIDVLGAGAMGCLFGALLSRANEVRLVDPNRAKLNTLKDRGVTVLEPDGRSFTAFPGLRTPEDGSGGPPDLLLIFVKSAAEKEALAAVGPTLGPDTALLTLQNGMGHEKAMGEAAPPERILLGATQHNASLQSVGTVRHGGAGSTQLGALAGNGELARAAAAAFTAAGIETAVSADVRAVIWRKLFMNASASALTGVFRCPLGDVAISGSCAAPSSGKPWPWRRPTAMFSTKGRSPGRSTATWSAPRGPSPPSMRTWKRDGGRKWTPSPARWPAWGGSWGSESP